MSTKTSKAPVTMADLLAKKNTSIKNLSTGQRIKGKVIQKLSKSLIVDISGKAEGVVMEKAYAEAREYISKLKVGDEVTVTVLVPEMRDGSTLLSLRDAVSQASWQAVEDAFKGKTEVAVYAKGVSGAGISVDVNGISGFVPMSQVSKELSKDASNLVGKYFKAKVIEVDRLKNKLVLSEREVTDAKDIALAKKALEKIKDGDIFEGVVTTVANFGCFVKIVSDIEGLVHISELSWGKVAHPSSLFKVGSKVKVKVIGTNDGKLALSVKHAQKDPWIKAGEKYKAEDKISGTVTKITDFGNFVELVPGIEGLVHITKIPPGKRFSVGDLVNCYIEEIDPKSRKISLGLVLTEIPVGYK
ncbi:MAG: S1 RNA-binding domain-containing protein [Candidatus Woesebacteria bacterium]|nr:S1 RNA-binding domain-containing protein [Candidatus Woesebacteria bacterium]